MPPRKFGEEGLGGRKTAQEKNTNSWERRFPRTFRTNVPLILPIFSVFSVGGGPKVPRNFWPSWELFFLILGGFSLAKGFDLETCLSNGCVFFTYS